MFPYEVKMAAIKQWLGGVSISSIMSQYGIRGSATLYEWVRLFNFSGAKALQGNLKSPRTYHPYSFKIEVIKWRLTNHASLTATAKHFNLRTPNLVWEWERALREGRLKPSKGRPPKLTKTNNHEDDELQKLKDENEILKLRNAYLEKLHALAQKKRKSQTKKKPK